MDFMGICGRGRSRKWRWARLLALCCLALASHPAAAGDAPEPALRRGISLSNWLADAQAEPMTARDFQAIKNSGFDHVRIPVDPELLGFSLFDALGGRMLFDFAKLDGAVNTARDTGLAAVIDVQGTEAFVSQVDQDPSAEAAFVALWQRLADHYKLYSAAAIVFEIPSGPGGSQTDQPKYRALVSDVVGAIRRAMPNVVVIADLPRSATLQGLDGFMPFDDANVIYGLHFYEPYLFTHQGLKGPASYGYSLRNFRSLPYPSSLVDPPTNYAPVASDPIEVKTDLLHYVTENWNASHIAARIKLAGDWAKANHQRIQCTEFGVVRKSVPPEARYAWIADTRRALEANDIGWDLWDYADAFGITALASDAGGDAAETPRMIEPEAANALFK